MIDPTRAHAPHWLAIQRQGQHNFVVVLSSQEQQHSAGVINYLSNRGIVVESVPQLANTHTEVLIRCSSQEAWALFQSLLLIAREQEFDIAVLPVVSRKKKLMLCDMDSTIVSSETLDDIAANVGIGTQVSEITTRAMRGELDFRQALDQRVALLKGLSETVLSDVINTISFNSGAEALLKQARLSGVRTILVSGGFELIVKHVADTLGFDSYICNRIQLSEGKLSGKVIEPVVDSNTKRDTLREQCKEMGIELAESCCIGDGANDLAMLTTAGLGIDFHAKPIVKETTPYQINFSGLDFALSIMGIAK